MTLLPLPVTIRTMQLDDLREADMLRDLAGWNQQLTDWRRMLRLDPDGCFVAALPDGVVGTVTTIRYGTDLGWIGMMLVHPEYRRRGIAQRLMETALVRLQQCGVRCIRLDATPAGEPVYRKLGFVDEWQFSRWHCANPASAATAAAATESLVCGWPPSSNGRTLDRMAFGTDRSQLLESLQDSCLCGLQTAETAEPQDTGFGMLRPGQRASSLGPIAAGSPRVASLIVTGLLRHAPQDVFWDVPEPNGMAVQLAEQLGFDRLRPLLRMRFGPVTVMPRLDLQYALVDPAVG